MTQHPPLTNVVRHSRTSSGPDECRPELTSVVRVIAALLLLLAGATTASAQFETPNRSFHNATGFPLEGRHQAVPCASCHLNGQQVGTPKTCFECHWMRRKDDVYETRLGTQCEQCHRPTAWSAVSFNHAALTGVPLNASHRQLDCRSCHLKADFKTTPNCVTCHRRDYDSSRNPAHAAAGFPVTCDACHRADENSWQTRSAGFSHAAIFPLVGVHAAQTCETCHKRNVYRGTSTDCVGCHQADYTKTQSPSHVAAGFPTTCDTCHRATDPQWRGANFSHTAFFALVGVHATQSCAACHKNNVYRGTARDCVGCHQTEYIRTTAPSHTAAGFPTTCESCHRPTDAQWQGASFNHSSVFALVGVHGTQSCATCHKNNVYRGTPRDCVGCHQTDYSRTTSPNHAAAGFPTTCETCHRPTDAQWRGSTFNHNAVFALVGVHASQACAACHVNNVYAGTARDCVGCHRTEYTRTTSPSHAAAGFPTSCETCHRPTDPQWRGVTFNHGAVFSLVGVHATQACASCHQNNVYRGTPRDCIGCHQTEYSRTTAPNHAAAGFPTACDSCHRPTDAQWRGVTFNHGAFFSLVGVHATQSCATCHQNNVYRGTPRTCAGCHQTDYNRTRSPNHASAGFPTICDTCHRATDTSWAQGRFTHTWFPLNGPHNVSCERCHTTANNFVVFSCTACHDRTKTDKDHKGVGGYRYDSTACYACHPNGKH